MPFEVTLPNSDHSFVVESQEELDKLTKAQTPEQSQNINTQNALRDNGYLINNDFGDKIDLDKNGHKYVILGKDFEPVVSKVVEYLKPGFQQINPLNEPMNKAIALSKGLGDTSGFNWALNKVGLGPNEATQQRIQEAVSSQPVSNFLGQVGGMRLGAAALAEKAIAEPIIEVLPKAYKALEMLPAFIRGGVSGSTVEAVSNKDATPGDIIGSGLLSGGLSGASTGLVKGLIKGGKGAADLWTGFITGAPKYGSVINESFGPTLSTASIAEKNAASLIKGEAKLESLLSNYSDVKLPINNVISPNEIKNLADGMFDLKVPNTKVGNKLMDIYERSQSRYITPEDANFIKRVLYDEGYHAGSIKNTKLAQSARSKARSLVELMQDNLPDDAAIEFRSINKNLSEGISLKKALDKAVEKGWFGSAKGFLEPVTLPVSTSIGSGLRSPTANYVDKLAGSPLLQRLSGLAGAR